MKEQKNSAEPKRANSGIVLLEKHYRLFLETKKQTAQHKDMNTTGQERDSTNKNYNKTTNSPPKHLTEGVGFKNVRESQKSVY